MSLIRKYSVIVGCLCLLGVGFGSALFYFSQNFGRGPASILPAPRIGKPQRTIDIVITPVNGIPASNNQELVLRADATLLQPLGQDIDYKWILPSDAVIVDGDLEDVWQNLQPGQTASVIISVLNVSRETPKTVVFQAFGNVDGVRMGSTTAFSTAPGSVDEDSQGTLSAQKVQRPSEKQSDALQKVQQ